MKNIPFFNRKRVRAFFISATLFIGFHDATGDIKIGLYGSHLRPIEVDTLKFGQVGWGGELKFIFHIPGTWNLLDVVTGIEYVNLVENKTKNSMTGNDRLINHDYLHPSIGVQIGKDIGRLIKPYFEVKGGAVSYRITIDTFSTPGQKEESTRTVFGFDVMGGLNLKFNNRFTVDVGVRYVKFNPDYIQGYAGVNIKVSVPKALYRANDLRTIPYFPWPPPKASAWKEVPSEFLKKPIDQTTHLADIEQRLRLALDSCGYSEKSYYYVTDGFVLVTKLEQIHHDGRSKEPPERWIPEVQPLRKLSLSEYLKALFGARPGYFRIIVFVVTPLWFNQAGSIITREEANRWLSDGVTNKLPEPIGNLKYSPIHTCTALIYEFEQTAKRKKAIFRIPGRLTGIIHLERNNLWNFLER